MEIVYSIRPHVKSMPYKQLIRMDGFFSILKNGCEYVLKHSNARQFIIKTIRAEPGENGMVSLKEVLDTRIIKRKEMKDLKINSEK